MASLWWHASIITVPLTLTLAASLATSSQLYWNWSWDDLVVNDLPAMVDFVNTQTGQKPHYIGHSMV